MAQPSRSIDHLLAYSMFPVWAGAILMLLIVIALAQVPAAQRVEERRMEAHLQRVIRAVQSDIRAMNAFTRDWGGSGTRATISWLVPIRPTSIPTCWSTPRCGTLNSMC